MEEIIKKGAVVSEFSLGEEPDAPLKKERIKNRNLSLSSEEAEIFNLLKEEPYHIDLLVKLSRFPASKVGELLMRLQIKGLIRELPGKLFCKR